MQEVIILGANGFIGSNLTKKLSSLGVLVHALVDRRFPYSHLQGIEHVICEEFSLGNIDDFDFKYKLDGCDIIYHLAWEGVNAKLRNEGVTQAQNVIYGLKVLEFAEKNHIGRVLIPGSASEVACGDGLITGREMPAPSDLYSASKVATRYLCQEYAKENGIELIWTLVTSIYGPGRDDNNLISYAIKSLLKGERPSFTKLEQKWDYLYIDDLLDALVALGENGKGGKVYPIGSGEYRQMLEYVNIIKENIAPNASLGIGDLPYKTPNKIDNQMMDISELKNDTGFEPKFDFKTGIANVIDYFKAIAL